MGMHLPFYKHGVEAIIDWDLIEAQQTLDQIEESNAVSVETLEADEDRQGAGTMVILTNLSRRWTRKSHHEVSRRCCNARPARLSL